MLDDVVMLALDELGLSPGDVQLELARGIRAARADAGLLQRVVVNLLDNALRFSPRGFPPIVITRASSWAGSRSG